MAKRALFVLTVLLVSALTSAAWACGFATFTANADCAGWMAEGSLILDEYESVELGYVVDIYHDPDGSGYVFIDRIMGGATVYNTNPTYSFSGTYGMDLCGDYWVRVYLYFTCCGSYHYMLEDFCFYCPCNGEYCQDTPGFWKDHPEAWPVSSLILGDTPYTMVQLMRILDTPTRGDIRIILAQHLIAAKLNVLSGDDPLDDIGDADAYLTAHGLLMGPHPTGSDKQDGVAIKDALVAYNEYCPSTIPCDGTAAGLSASAPAGLTSGAESKSWGAIKSLYK